LRRTCASGCAPLGVAPHVVEAVLNHKSGQVRGVAAIYNRYSYSTEKREALDLWAEHVERCAGNIIVARPVEISSDFSTLLASWRRHDLSRRKPLTIKATGLFQIS